MVILARKVEFPTVWADAEGDDLLYALCEFVDARKGAEGMSWWEVPSQDASELARIAAALFFGTGQSSPRSAQFRFVDTEELEGLGVTLRKTKGKVQDAELAERHFDIVDLPAPLAVEVAKKLTQAEPRTISAPDVIKELAAGLAAKRIPHGKLTKDGLSTLRAHGQLTVAGAPLERA